MRLFRLWPSLTVFLYLSQILNTSLWLREDVYPLTWDYGHHYIKSLRAYFYLSHWYLPIMGGGPFEALKTILSESLFRIITTLLLPLNLVVSLSAQIYAGSKHPFLVYSATAPFYLILGHTPDVAIIIVSAIFLGILMFSVYNIGARLCGPTAGFWASLITSFYPIIFGMTRVYSLDIPLTAMVALSIYLLLRTDDFTNRRYSTAFGVSLGLGMLTKEIFFIFLLGPLGCFLCRLFRKDRIEDSLIRKERLYNIKKSTTTALIIASIWYIPYSIGFAERFFSYLSLFLHGNPKNEHVAGFLQGISSHLSFLINIQLSPLLFIVFLLALPIFILKVNVDKGWLLSWIILPYLFFFLFPVKDPRYTIPSLPAFALITAFAFAPKTHILSLKGPWQKAQSLALSAIVIFCLIQYGILSWGIPGLNLPSLLVNTSNLYAQRPRIEDWKSSEVLDAIRNIIKENNNLQYSRKGQEIKAVALFDVPQIIYPIKYHEYLNLMNSKYGLNNLEIPIDIDFGGMDKKTIRNRIHKSDFILIKDGGYVGPLVREDAIRQALQIFRENGDKILLVAKFSLPDGSHLLLYRRSDYSKSQDHT